MKKNRFTGKVELENGMIMVFNTFAIATFEDLTGKNAFEELEKLNEKVSFSVIVDLYHACLLPHNPDMTRMEAAELVDEYPDALATVIEVATVNATTQEDAAPASNSKGTTKKK